MKDPIWMLVVGLVLFGIGLAIVFYALITMSPSPCT